MLTTALEQVPWQSCCEFVSLDVGRSSRSTWSSHTDTQDAESSSKEYQMSLSSISTCQNLQSSSRLTRWTELGSNLEITRLFKGARICHDIVIELESVEQEHCSIIIRSREVVSELGDVLIPIANPSMPIVVCVDDLS
ncbi:hypothetical protein MRB53_038818 [Persea americana]|nr:hypothetical protein MRB53_038818 [Persea americana]